MEAPTLRSGYCRGCLTISRWRFAGYATETGFENTDRPRGYYRTCTTCGLRVLTLAEVEDVEGLCRAQIDSWLRAQPDGVRFPATGDPPPYGDGRVDLADCLAEIMHDVWKLYLRYRPAVGSSFLGYAASLLSRRVVGFVREATGDATARRAEAKLHARSVTLDSVTDVAAPEDRPVAGGLVEALRGNPRNAGDDRPRDRGGLQAEGDRRPARSSRAAGQPKGDAGTKRDSSAAA